jgi:hypothetical protein
MSAQLICHDWRVTENPWHRLHRLAEARRTVLDITLTTLQAQGGPSPKWVHNLLTQEGAPTPRQARKLAALDRVLHWPAGTSWGLVADDRSTWSQDLLDDEERTLVHEQTDEVDAFTYNLNFRLRAFAEHERTRIMRAILALVGYEGERPTRRGGKGQR